ncbi:MAG: MAPEG family protein [Dokdonella sp.]
MSIEMQMLAWTIVLVVIQIVIAATLSVSQRGLGWAAGPRDGTPLQLTGIAGRMERALRNMLETFPLFAAAVLAVIAIQHTNAHTALGAQLYFWARLAYVPAYAVTLPYVRTLVWAVSLVGLIMVVSGLF